MAATSESDAVVSQVLDQVRDTLLSIDPRMERMEREYVSRAQVVMCVSEGAGTQMAHYGLSWLDVRVSFGRRRVFALGQCMPCDTFAVEVHTHVCSSTHCTEGHAQRRSCGRAHNG